MRSPLARTVVTTGGVVLVLGAGTGVVATAALAAVKGVTAMRMVSRGAVLPLRLQHRVTAAETRCPLYITTS